MRILYKTLLALWPILFISISAFAQGGPPATPIDGGLSFLLAAGGAYGMKKLRDSRRSK